MPGLLDFLNSDDARLGLSLLDAAGPQTKPMSTGQVFASAFNNFQKGRDDATDRKLRELLTRSQIDENTSQNQVRASTIAKAAQQAEWDRQFMGLPPSGTAASTAAPAAPAMSGGLLDAAPAPGGAPAGAAPAATPTAPGAPFGGMTAAQISQRYGVPLDQVISDYKFNSGKKIAEFINDRTKPSWQTVGGNLVNTNAPGFTGGIMDQVQVGPDGRTVVVRGGANPSVSAAGGSVDTFGAFEDRKNQSNAAFTPGRPVLDAAGRLRSQSQLAEVGGGPAPGLPGRPLGAPVAPVPGRQFNSPGAAGGSTATAAVGQAEILTSELGKAQQEFQHAQQTGDVAGARRAQQDIAGIQRELTRLPGGAQALAGTQAPPRAPVPLIGPGAGQPVPAAATSDAAGALDFSPEEKAAQAANSARLVDSAKADVVRDTGAQKAVKSATEMLSDVKRAKELLGQSPTSSTAGMLVDSTLGVLGGSRKAAEVADRLDVVAGSLTKNVPRMEGPQSDGDREEYKTQAGRVGNRSLSTARRLAAADEVEKLQRKYASFNQASPSGAGAPPPKAQVFNDLPPAAQFKGRSVRDTETGKTMVSDGMSWKAKE